MGIRSGQKNARISSETEIVKEEIKEKSREKSMGIRGKTKGGKRK